MKTLDDIPLTRLYQAQQMAQMRLQLWFTGTTQEMLLDFVKQAKAIFLSNADADGNMDSVSSHRAQIALLNAWGDMFTVWVQLFNKARREATALPFGVLSVYQSRVVKPRITKLNESRPTLHSFSEAVSYTGSVFNPQLRLLMDAAGEYIYGDGLNLSGRIWRLDRETRKGINDILMNGLASGESAWNLAQQLEISLGANQNCPRWTWNRLNLMSKAEIATNSEGLLSSDACDGKGVAYKALRLARTEFQRAHALATDKQLAMSPWVEKEKINLSPAHVGNDECNEAADGGEDGKGIYPVGTISLPLHTHCMCFKTAVTMSDTDFTDKLRGWVNSSDKWPEMDSYADSIGGADVDLNADPSALALGVWLWGNQEDIAGRMS